MYRTCVLTGEVRIAGPCLDEGELLAVPVSGKGVGTTGPEIGTYRQVLFVYYVSVSELTEGVV